MADFYKNSDEYSGVLNGGNFLTV